MHEMVTSHDEFVRDHGRHARLRRSRIRETNWPARPNHAVRLKSPYGLSPQNKRPLRGGNESCSAGLTRGIGQGWRRLRVYLFGIPGLNGFLPGVTYSRQITSNHGMRIEFNPYRTDERVEMFFVKVSSNVPQIHQSLAIMLSMRNNYWRISRRVVGNVLYVAIKSDGTVVTRDQSDAGWQVYFPRIQLNPFLFYQLAFDSAMVKANINRVTYQPYQPTKVNDQNPGFRNAVTCCTCLTLCWPETVGFEPCGHTQTCDSCAARQVRCGLCTTRIERYRWPDWDNCIDAPFEHPEQKCFLCAAGDPLDERPASVILLPCRHFMLCRPCSQRVLVECKANASMPFCPMCTNDIEEMIRPLYASFPSALPDLSCVLCAENGRDPANLSNTCILPCCHYIACEPCGKKLKHEMLKALPEKLKCPQCGEFIDKIIRAKFQLGSDSDDDDDSTPSWLKTPTEDNESEKSEPEPEAAAIRQTPPERLDPVYGIWRWGRP